MSTETYVVTGTGADAKNTIVKDPNAVLDYTFDWSEWLDAITDTLASQSIVA